MLPTGLLAILIAAADVAVVVFVVIVFVVAAIVVVVVFDVAAGSGVLRMMVGSCGCGCTHSDGGSGETGGHKTCQNQPQEQWQQ